MPFFFARPFASSPVRLYIHDDKQLDLSSKKYEAAQAKVIARELATNSTLTKLNLDTNNIGDDGTKRSRLL
jgi:hypothetical protein